VTDSTLGLIQIEASCSTNRSSVDLLPARDGDDDDEDDDIDGGGGDEPTVAVRVVFGVDCATSDGINNLICPVSQNTKGLQHPGTHHKDV